MAAKASDVLVLQSFSFLATEVWAMVLPWLRPG